MAAGDVGDDPETYDRRAWRRFNWIQASLTRARSGEADLSRSDSSTGRDGA